MVSKIENLLAIYQGNAYPAMFESLGKHLGVPAEALTALGLGWAPMVPFKKGPNYQGWWVIPELDDMGTPIGLSLRSQRDMKCMYPGSKHGLTYAVNEHHARGRVSYQSGEQNWVRTMDAQVLCPLCEKPDGCIVSAENPEDPQAVICIRKSSSRPQRFGYLHILKEEGHLRTDSSALPPSDLPVVIVEGMTDTAAAMGLGYVAVGRPSNLAGMDALSDLVRGREVIIVGENDGVNPTTGTRPGHDGMIATYQVLKRVCKDAVKVLPPPHIKDLRGWVQKGGLTAEAFKQYVDTQGDKADELTVLEDGRHCTVARAYLKDQQEMAGRRLIRYWNGEWYRYNGHRYVRENEQRIGNPLFEWAYHLKYAVEGAQETRYVPFDPSIHWEKNVLRAVIAEVDVPIAKQPCWVNGAKGPDPVDLIGFTNGILHIPKFLDGSPKEEYFLPSTPDFFTTTALPFPFDETATCPRWERVLQYALGDEPEQMRLLRQWFGYCLTSDMGQQKFMFFLGQSGAGKSMMLNVLHDLVGDDQYASKDFPSLTTDFGLHKIMDKLVVGIEEAQMTKHTDNYRAMDVLKRIVGQGDMPVNRKNKDEIDAEFICRFTLTANEFPHMPDHAGAMQRRMLVIEFPRAVEHPDDKLRQKLRSELQGIALWALIGLRDMRQNNGFVKTTQMQEALDEWRDAANPISSFIQDCCVVDKDNKHFLVEAEAYEAFSTWMEERGMRRWNPNTFRGRFDTNTPTYVKRETHMVKSHKVKGFTYIDLTPWAKRKLLGRPS